MKANRFSAAAILLAAGLSRRMGERNKLLIEIGGEPLVRRAAKVYLAAGVGVHAVVGHEAMRVRAVLEDLPIMFVENPHYKDGRQSSVLAGIESLAGAYDTVLVALADQAALSPADISGLLEAFSWNGGNRILIPYYRERRGNPVVFPAALIAEMRAQGLNAASRSFIDANPHLTQRYEAPNDHFAIDIDAPDDLAAFK
ncbi:MAG: nucleotidyltransferase family protein, partial [Rhodomicrobium sp.]|nr:nucleotidyltransferase family protein [Rhodomicrobium sp.]